jgi:hypothetical protein
MTSTRQATEGPGGRAPRHYEITVRGAIGPTLLQAFPTLIASRRGPDTVLGGPLADRSALYGAIHQLEALGLELLEIRSRPSVRGEIHPNEGMGDSPSRPGKC